MKKKTKDLCDNLKVKSLSTNNQILRTFDTFLDKVKYFYQEGGSHKNLISCIPELTIKDSRELVSFILKSPESFQNIVDLNGFSAMYYLMHKSLYNSEISELKSAGLKEILPVGYGVEHLSKHHYYFHKNKTTKTAVVFLGEDVNYTSDIRIHKLSITKGDANDVNMSHILFMKGYNVILIDARVTKITKREAYEIVHHYSREKIDLFYINSHGTESAVQSDWHVLPMLGSKVEKRTTTQSLGGTVTKVEYSENSIKTSEFLLWISLAARGYGYFIADLFIGLGLSKVFPGDPLNVILASCRAQLAANDLKRVLPKGSEVLMFGEKQIIEGIEYIHDVTDMSQIRMFNSIDERGDLNSNNVNLMSFSNAYTMNVDNRYGVGSPYYLKVIGHTLWFSPITKEFSCISVQSDKSHNSSFRKILIDSICNEDQACERSMHNYIKDDKSNDIFTYLYMQHSNLIEEREKKSDHYSKMLTINCNIGYLRPELNLKDYWTYEYLAEKFSEAVDLAGRIYTTTLLIIASIIDAAEEF